jgi:glycosyltransferase involved in cell wall biosynthesis
MAHHTPVVSSNVSSLPEVVGDAALTVPPEDVDALSSAIARVLGDGALRQRLIERGLVRATSFRWRDTALQTLAVYDELGR